MPERATVTLSKRETLVNSRSVTSVSAKGSTPWIRPPSWMGGSCGLPSERETMTLPTKPSVWMAALLSARRSWRASSRIARTTEIGWPGASGSWTRCTRPTEIPL